MTTAAPSRPSATGLSGPVSAALEADLRSSVRRHGIVVWLDQAGTYSEFVERLQALRAAGALPYQVQAFRGSHLALMMALDGVAAGTEKAPLVIHLPGFTEETVRQTPLFELYAAGVRYRKALDTLVTEAASGQVRPDQIDSFRAQPGMTLAGADAWLSALLDGAEGGIGAQLRAMSPTAVLDDLLTGGIIAGRIGELDAEDALWERFAAWIGLPSFWRDATLPPSQPRAGDVAFAAASWALCVEYTDDLKRAPASDHLASAAALPRPVIDACRAVAAHLREHHAGFYQRTADETEALLADEVEQAQAEDLGGIDTFRFEEDKVLKAALAALGRAAYDQAAGWAGPRVEPTSADMSFWLRDDPARQSAWQLVREAARLGQEIARAGTRIGVDARADAAIEAAMAAYAERGAAVDQAHRLLEQRRVALLYPLLPEFETLRARLDGMRRVWREWADAWAREFNALCTARGFLPGASHQQRTLFDEVVRPLAEEPGTTAYFVVDALRFEMGEELYRQMEGTPATTAALRPRLAELPTVTEVGMNVLAPVARNGRLQVSLAGDAGGVLGFQTGEFRVCDPETRKRAMHDRVGGATCPWLTLDEVVSRDTASLKRSVSQARLVVVHSREIDEAGEKGIGPAVFDLALQKLRAAWRVLREAGVRRFVFTADHGFLLLDDDAAAVQAHGRRVDPQRRHVFSPAAADHAGEVQVALADLRYEGTGTSVIFPETTAVFEHPGGRWASRTAATACRSASSRCSPWCTARRPAGAASGTASPPRPARAWRGCTASRPGSRSSRSSRWTSEARRRSSSPCASPTPRTCRSSSARRVAGRGSRAARSSPPSASPSSSSSGSPGPRTRVRSSRSTIRVPSRTWCRACRTPGSPSPRRGRPRHRPPPRRRSARQSGTRWLEQFPDPGVRQVFEHLAAHGAVTESEAAAMLGGPRGLRRFALQFEAHAQKAPFAVRIDVVAGVKRYVREGSG